LNILYLDPYSDTSYSKRYLYYEGLYNSLIKTNNVYLHRDLIVDYNAIKRDVPFTPDVILFGLSWFEKHQYFDKINNLDIPSVCFIFKPVVNLQKKIDFCKINQIDLILTPNHQFEKFSEMACVPAKLFPYGFDPAIFQPRNFKKKYDIGFSGALHGANHYSDGAFKNKNIRSKIHDLLKNINEINFFWKSTDVLETARIHDNIEYAETINSSKIWIATQAAYGEITPRYFEIMASGTLLFCEKNPVEYSHVFKDGYNCIEFDSSLDNFEYILIKLLKNPVLFNQVTQCGKIDAMWNQTWDVRASQFVSLVQEFL
jgi:hypothetical protein